MIYGSKPSKTEKIVAGLTCLLILITLVLTYD